MRFILPLFLFLWCMVPVKAQSSKVAVRTLSLYPAPMPELYTPDGKELIPLEFTDVQPSEPTKLDRLKSLPIYTTPVIPEGEAPPPYSVRLPGNASAVLLLGWLGPEEKPQFLAIPDPSASARQDDWMVINSTKQNVAIQVGVKSKPVPVKAGSHQTIKVNVPVNRGAGITMAAPKGDEWKTFYSTYWPVHPDRRYLILIVQDGEKMRVKPIFEFLPKPATP